MEDKLSLVEGSGLILDNIKFKDIFISRNAVPHVGVAYVKYPTGWRGEESVINPHPVQDLEKKACILQCHAAYKLYKHKTTKSMKKNMQIPM